MTKQDRLNAIKTLLPGLYEKKELLDNEIECYEKAKLEIELEITDEETQAIYSPVINSYFEQSERIRRNRELYERLQLAHNQLAIHNGKENNDICDQFSQG